MILQRDTFNNVYIVCMLHDKNNYIIFVMKFVFNSFQIILIAVIRTFT